MTTQELITKLREETRWGHKANREIRDLCLDAADRLEHMAKATAEGRLVELPCKLGDTVFSLEWDIKADKYKIRKGVIKTLGMIQATAVLRYLTVCSTAF